jgi:K+ transporter
MKTLYDQDFYEWTQENARLLRERRFSEIDIDNLVEELEIMGRSEKRAFVNHLAVLIAHLLKWERQTVLRSRSWKYTIREQRAQVADILADNPSFKHSLDEMLSKAYGKAIIRVVKETGLDEEAFPAACPYGFEDISDTGFFPGGNA